MIDVNSNKMIKRKFANGFAIKKELYSGILRQFNNAERILKIDINIEYDPKD